MPTYDYRCRSCGKRAAIFQTYAEYGTKAVECPHCGSADLRRLIGRVRVVRSGEARARSFESIDSIDENDPRAMARMMREMSAEIGEEMPAELGEVVDRLEAGEDPASIEGSLPDLDGDDFSPGE